MRSGRHDAKRQGIEPAQGVVEPHSPACRSIRTPPRAWRVPRRSPRFPAAPPPVPTQPWIPVPKVMCPVARRLTSNVPGLSQRRGSRLAAANSSSTFSPSPILTPDMSTALVVVRKKLAPAPRTAAPPRKRRGSGPDFREEPSIARDKLQSNTARCRAHRRWCRYPPTERADQHAGFVLRQLRRHRRRQKSACPICPGASAARLHFDMIQSRTGPALAVATSRRVRRAGRTSLNTMLP